MTEQFDRRQTTDHDVLIEVKVKLDSLIEKVDALTDDHEARIRILEYWRWYVIGLSTAGGAVASVLIDKLT